MSGIIALWLVVSVAVGHDCQHGYTMMGKLCSDTNATATEKTVDAKTIAVVEGGLDQLRTIGNLQERSEYAAELIELIRLPEQPRLSDYKRYIRLLIDIGQYQSSITPYNPASLKLANLPHKKIAILLDEIDRRNRQHVVAMYGLQLITRDEDRENIIGRFARDYRYYPVIMHMGWQEAAREAALAALRADLHQLFSSEFLELCLSYNDDRFNALFVEHLRRGRWPNHAYRTLAKVEGVDFSGALADGFRRLMQRGEVAAVAELTPALMEAGHKPALDFVVDAYPRNYGLRPQQLNSVALLERYLALPPHVELANLHVWYRENRERIAFDEAAARFRLH